MKLVSGLLVLCLLASAQADSIKYFQARKCFDVLNGGVVSGGRVGGRTLPEGPRVTVDQVTPPTTVGSTITVCASGCNYTTFAAAYAAAVCGDKITLKAGESFTVTSTNTLAKQCSSSTWIRITSDTEIVSSGTRASQANGSSMPLLITNGINIPFFTLSGGASYHYFDNLALRIDATKCSNFANAVFSVGIASEATPANIPNNITLDRIVITEPSATCSYRRGILLTCETCAVVNSNIWQHDTSEGQGIWVQNTRGPLRIENNEIQGSGENILFGGSSPAAGADYFPKDVVFRRNWLYKKHTWKSDDPSYIGVLFNAKNIWECKAAQRVLIEGNVLQLNYVQGQDGQAISLVMTSAAGAGSNNTVCGDLEFRYNVFAHVGVVMAGGGLNGSDESPCCLQRLFRIYFHNNLAVDVNSRAGTDGVGAGSSTKRIINVNNGGRAFTFLHNTLLLDGTTGSIANADPASSNASTVPINTGNLLWYQTWQDNIVQHGSNGYKVTSITGGTLSLNASAGSTGYTYSNNAMVQITGSGLNSGSYPGGNFFPANWGAGGSGSTANVDMVDQAACNDNTTTAIPTLTNCKLNNTSAYYAGGTNQATDGTNMGADIDAIIALVTGIYN